MANMHETNYRKYVEPLLLAAQTVLTPVLREQLAPQAYIIRDIRANETSDGEWDYEACLKAIAFHNSSIRVNGKSLDKLLSSKAHALLALRNERGAHNHKRDISLLECQKAIGQLRAICEALGGTPHDIEEYYDEVARKIASSRAIKAGSSDGQNQTGDTGTSERSEPDSIVHHETVGELENMADTDDHVDEKSRTKAFRSETASLARSVINCQQCEGWAGKLGLPNPGWVGSGYEPGKGLIVLLQNPAIVSANYGIDRDAILQDAILKLGTSESVADYDSLVERHIDDMLGFGDANWEWPMWSGIAGKIVADRLRPAELAWLNVAKHRTAANEPLTPEQINHGLGHLKAELRLLNPFIVLTVGAPARVALDRLLNTGAVEPPVHTVAIAQRGASHIELLEAARKVRIWLDERDGVLPETSDLPVSIYNTVNPDQPQMDRDGEVDWLTPSSREQFRDGKLVINPIGGSPVTFKHFLLNYDTYASFRDFDVVWVRYCVYLATGVAHKTRQLPMATPTIDPQRMPDWATDLAKQLRKWPHLSVLLVGQTAFGKHAGFDRVTGARKQYDME